MADWSRRAPTIPFAPFEVLLTDDGYPLEVENADRDTSDLSGWKLAEAVQSR